MGECLRDFASSGFDLDAVGVINQKNATGVSQTDDHAIVQIYPNPVNDFVRVYTSQTGYSQVQITDISGRIIADGTFQQTTKIQLDKIPSGIYTIRVINDGSVISKLIVKE